MEHISSKKGTGKFQTYISIKTVYFCISVSGILIISAMAHGFYIGNHLIEKYVPLVNTASMIRIETTTAHLWFEEVISGDKTVEIGIVRKKLDNARKYAEAMINGGISYIHGKIIPLKSRFLISEMKDVIEKIDEFRNITEIRYKNSKDSKIGSAIDQKYDEVFKDFIDKTKNVEANLVSEIERQRIQFRNSHIILVVISFLLFIYIFFLTMNFNRRRVEYISDIRETNEDLHKAIAEIKTLQGIIPICSYCNKIRDKKGLWNQLEVYIHEHSHAEFSHGICPDCYQKQMNEFRARKEKI